MAHIADCLFEPANGLGLNNYIARELSPQRLLLEKSGTPPPEPSMEKDKFVWRMLQPAESRKQHPFQTKERPSMISGQKAPESSSPLALKSLEKERSKLGAALRLKSKDQSTRRRKISTPETYTMATVQEIPMDSPTIPGRAPLHERSISAPGNTWGHHTFGDAMLSSTSGPFDEVAEMARLNAPNSYDSRRAVPRSLELSQRQPAPASPRTLAPLVIPPPSVPLPELPELESHRGETPGPVVPPKSARMLEFSPALKSSSSKAYSSMTPVTSIASTLASATINTPSPQLSSAQRDSSSSRASPQPCSATMNPPQTRSQTPDTKSISGHQRAGSESSSIMDRGRPKKRSQSSASVRKQTAEEREAFVALPQSSNPASASIAMPADDIEALRKQAMGQASRFGVLGPKDVENLSRELRSLDERCDYLRKAIRNLSATRRTLQDQVCAHLLPQQLALFSREWLLKQHEALAKLNTSIEDWVNKLDSTENRRTRVRQKLLEHVAAALMLDPGAQVEKERERQISISLQNMRGEYTPPHSPVASRSPSPALVPRTEVQSIRIYAHSDVFALLADVEDEMNRMGSESEQKKRDRPRKRSLSLESAAVMQSNITLNATTFEGLGPHRVPSW